MKLFEAAIELNKVGGLEEGRARKKAIDKVHNRWLGATYSNHFVTNRLVIWCWR